MSEPKYYTPELWEFHVGFEFEYLTPNGSYKIGNWDDKLIDHGELNTFTDEIEKTAHSICRVKFLDREDIESLGWKDVGQDEYQIDVKDSAFSWQLEKAHDDVLQSFWRLNTEDNSQIIWLQIRNKSELARVMKMVGITK